MQVYPKSWTAIYIPLDNVGMWNLRSEFWARQYLGQQFYMRVYTTSTSIRDEYPVPKNALLCGRASGRHTRPLWAAKSFQSIWKAVYFSASDFVVFIRLGMVWLRRTCIFKPQVTPARGHVNSFPEKKKKKNKIIFFLFFFYLKFGF